MSNNLFSTESIFDPEPQSFQQPFEFLPLESDHLDFLRKHQATIYDIFTCIQFDTQYAVTSLFGLYGPFLIQFEDKLTKKPVRVLEVIYSRLIESQNSIFLTKNQVTFELQFQNQIQRNKWIKALQNVCVLTDFHQKYQKQRLMRKSSTAMIYNIQSKIDQQSFVAKIFDKKESGLLNNTNLKTSILSQIGLLKHLNHPNIVQLYEVYETEDSLHLIMDLVQGTSLEEIFQRPTFLKEFSIDRITYILYQILDAVAYLASEGIMHRDLKPANILIDKNDQVKIIELGLASYIDVPAYVFKRCGSAGYIAPEVFHYICDTPCTKYNDRCDVFSIGCILFDMIFGKPLFEGTASHEILDSNRDIKVLCSRLLEIQREIDSPKSRHNKSVLNLLLLLLEPNFKVRISASHALHHNFFNKAYSQKAPQKHCIKIYPVLSTTPPNMAALKEYNCKLHHKCSIFETEASDSDMNRNKSLLSTRASEELSTSSSPQRKSYKSLRTSLFKSMKQVQETESQIKIESPPANYTSTTIFFSSSFHESPLSTSQQFWGKQSQKSGCCLPQSQEEDESEILDDAEVEDCKIGTFIEKIKAQEIQKTKAQMSRFN